MFNSPPSFEQLILPLTSPWQLWLLRLTTLFLIFLTLNRISLLLKPASKLYFWLFVFISPVPLILSLSYPLSALKMIVITLIILKTKPKKLFKLTSLALIVSFLFLINVKFLHQTPAFLSQLSLSRASAAVTDRFNKETLLNPSNPVPLAIKRIAYNKYFFVIKESSEQILRFFDLENLFFQENPPQEQKSEPIFFWGELVLLALAFYFWTQGKLPLTGKEDLFFMASLSAFSLTDDVAFLRYLLAFLLIVIILSQAVPRLLGQKRFLRLTTLIFLSSSIYGGLAHFVDRQKRLDYWLDVRPVIYQKFMNTIPLDSYSQIYIADILGQGKAYCRYYRRDCQKFIFENFQISKIKPQVGVLYVGFLGNFFGPDPYTNYTGWHIVDNGLYDRIKVVSQSSFAGNPVNGYGQRIIFAVKNPLYEDK